MDEGTGVCLHVRVGVRVRVVSQGLKVICEFRMMPDVCGV